MYKGIVKFLKTKDVETNVEVKLETKYVVNDLFKNEYPQHTHHK